MSFQWHLIAAFLYVEVGVVTLLLLPFVSAQRWHKIFKSRFLRGLGQQVNIYFYIIFGLLILCLIDAIREMNKYEAESGKAKDVHHHLEQELRNNMVLFRAQRNFYITGFSLFLVLVIRRLMTLLMTVSTLAASSEANLRQAESASRTAQELLSKAQDKEDTVAKEKHDELVSKKNAELEEAKEELTKAIKDKEAVKSQAEAVSREYDRLLDEYSRMEKKLAILKNDDPSDKKSD